jgi:hypothetical protein
MDAIEFLLCTLALDTLMALSVSNQEVKVCMLVIQMAVVIVVYVYSQIFSRR